MFTPPRKIQEELKSTAKAGSHVRLRSSHIYIDQEVASAVFGTDPNVNLIYYPERSTIMIAPASDELFKKLHKAKQHMLKNRNAKGDKSIAIHGLLIDNEVDSSDRDLKFESQHALKILNVKV